MNYLIKRKSGKKIVLYKLFASFLIIVILMMSIGLLIFNKSMSLINEEMLGKNQYILEKFSTTVDNALLDMLKISFALARQEEIRKLGYFDEASASNRYSLFKVTKILNSYKISNAYIKKAYIYLKDLDVFVTDSNLVDNSLLLKMNYGLSGIDQEVWDNLLESEHYAKVYLLNCGSETKLFFCQTLSLDSTSQNTVNLYLEIDINYIVSKIEKDYEIDNTDFSIFSGEEFISTLNSAIEIDKLPQYTNNEDVMDETYIDGERYLLSYNPSDYYNIDYYAYMPYYNYMQGLIGLRRYMVISLIALILLGTVMSLSFALANYYPINKLMYRLEKYSGLIKKERKNEIYVIDEIIGKIEEDRETMLHGNEIISKKYYNSILGDLIKGDMSFNEGIAKELQDQNMLNPGFNEFILIVILSDYLISKDNQIRISNTVFTCLSKLLNSDNSCQNMIDIDGNIVFFINAKSKTLSAPNEGPYKALDLAMQIIQEQFGIIVYMYISNVCNDFREIVKQYMQSQYIEDYKFFVTEQRIMRYADIIEAYKTSGALYYYSNNIETKLINYVINGHGNEAKKIMDGIYYYYKNQNKISLVNSKCLINDMIATFVKINKRIESRYDVSISEDMVSIDNLIKSKSIEGFFSNTKELIDKLVEIIDTNMDTNRELLIKKVHGYIKEQYSNPDLNCNTMAHYFNLNPSYLSHTYKEVTGEKLHHYINEYRIRVAEILLAENESVLQIVAEKVGFGNDAALIRIFKNHRGITPGEYRLSKKAL